MPNLLLLHSPFFFYLRHFYFSISVLLMIKVKLLLLLRLCCQAISSPSQTVKKSIRAPYLPHIFQNVSVGKVIIHCLSDHDRLQRKCGVQQRSIISPNNSSKHQRPLNWHLQKWKASVRKKNSVEFFIYRDEENIDLNRHYFLSNQ